MGAKWFQKFNSSSWSYGVEDEVTASYAGRSTVGPSVYIRSMRVRLLPGVFMGTWRNLVSRRICNAETADSTSVVSTHVSVAESGLWRQSGRRETSLESNPGIEIIRTRKLVYRKVPHVQIMPLTYAGLTEQQGDGLLIRVRKDSAVQFRYPA